MNLQTWLPAQDSPEIPVNENFDALSHMAVYAKDATTTVGLTWGYLGGRWGGFGIAAGTLSLTASATLYLTVARASGVLSASTEQGAWNNLEEHARVYKLVTGPATVTSAEDYRAGAGGVHGLSDGLGVQMSEVLEVSGAAHSIDLSHLGAYLRFTAPGGKTVTFNAAAVSFAKNQEYHITNRATAGNLTLIGSGVTLYPPKGGTLVLEPDDAVTVKFISAAAADVVGSTEAAP